MAGDAAATFSVDPSGRRKVIAPPAMVPPPNSTSRISDSEVTDLPDPLSPTTQTVSPEAMANDTSSTAVTGPLSVAKVTRR